MFRQGKTLNNNGFTIIEVLVVLFILGVILVPMFRVMILSYSTVQEQKSNAEDRENFRFFSTYMVEDLMYAKNVNVQNEEKYDVLSYTTKSGKLVTVYFDEENGISIKNNGISEKVVKGERYEDGIPMVRMEKDGIVHFNFYARPLNILLVTSVQPRPNGGMM